MKSILIAIFLLISGCASSNPNLLKGELFVNKKDNVEHKVKLKEKEFYQFTLYFD